MCRKDVEASNYNKGNLIHEVTQMKVNAASALIIDHSSSGLFVRSEFVHITSMNCLLHV